MLIAFKAVLGHSVVGTDDKVGSVHDVYFNGANWNVRYIVVDTGKWLSGRKVLLTPSIFERLDWAAGTLTVPLLRQRVKDSPEMDTDMPVSHENEIKLALYYDWPVYWGVGDMPLPPGGGPATSQPDARAAVDAAESEESRLRSAKEVNRYRIEATDGEIGHVEDFIIDDQAWVIRYLIVNTRNWLPGRSVVIPPKWAETIRWHDKKVCLDLTKEMIETAPQFDPSEPINRRYEEHLYDYYGRERYWA